MRTIENVHDLIESFYGLFEGRADHYGSEWGSCEEGDAYKAVERHLVDRTPCGIYPMREADNHVKWGCTDIDTGSMDEARTIYRALNLMELHPWLEVSRSKGYHVWVFARDWVPAAAMRRAFLHAHQAIDLEAKEVNPKQEKPGSKGLSNYVRLPYVGMTADSNGRRIMLDPGTGEKIPFDDFVVDAEQRLANPVTIQKWADRYKPPAPPVSHVYRPVVVSPALLERTSPWIRKVLAEGPASWRFEPGQGGRSKLLVRLAYECYKHGHPRDEAKAIVYMAASQWDLYTNRSNRDDLLEDVVRRAYG